MSRTATVSRTTSESTITVTVDLDGTGASTISTGVGFYDHMLTALARHSLIDLTVEATGDLHIDGHHTIEDTAICLGQALRQALGDKSGIRRFGHAVVPRVPVIPLLDMAFQLLSFGLYCFDLTADKTKVYALFAEE